MKCRLRNLLTLLSLLLCVAVAVLWVRSRLATDAVFWVTRMHSGVGRWAMTDAGVKTVPGGVLLGGVTEWRGVVGNPPAYRRSEWRYARAGLLDGREAAPQVLGAGWTRPLSPPTVTRPGRRVCVLRVPYWPLLAVTSVAPLAWAVGAARRWADRRSPPGMCRRCGYDLRATRGRCPECGQAGAGAGRAQV